MPELREIVILDGGIGSELQRHGVPMDGSSWCAEANLSFPDAVRAVHRSYVEAGSTVITANTFATSPLLFSALGRADEIETIDRAAVSLARREADSGIRVAGSFSTMRLVPEGGDRTALHVSWTDAEAEDLMAMKAEALARAGVDLIMMEMMRDNDYSLVATRAAVATGLPVWLGISVERRGDGELVGFGRPDMPVANWIAALCDTGVERVNVMHTAVDDVSGALAAVRSAGWSGPVGVYPESGYFTMPDWQFIDIIAPDDLVRLSHEWVAAGVGLLGGCCGLGPEHIAALVREHGRHD